MFFFSQVGRTNRRTNVLPHHIHDFLDSFEEFEIKMKSWYSPYTVAAIHARTVRIHSFFCHHFMSATCRRIVGRIDVGQTAARCVTVLQPHRVAAVISFDFGIRLRIGQIAIFQFVHWGTIGHSETEQKSFSISSIERFGRDSPLLEDI